MIELYTLLVYPPTQKILLAELEKIKLMETLLRIDSVLAQVLSFHDSKYLEFIIQSQKKVLNDVFNI